MLAVLLALAFATAPTSPACAYDASLLTLDVRRFDQTMGSGWRPLGDRPECGGAAADAIAAYRRARAATLVEGPLADIRGLNWHEAQLRAAAGQADAAVALFRRARPDLDPARGLYADATIAFLTHNGPALKSARARLVALPKPEWWDAAVTQAPPNRRPSWPEYLPEVDGFIACFDKPYSQAYSYICRPAARE